MPKENLYGRAGIRDVAEFYRNKFVSDEVLDARYFKTLDRFDIRFARTMWVYDNVRAGSHVLDLGCGAGGSKTSIASRRCDLARYRVYRSIGAEEL